MNSFCHNWHPCTQMKDHEDFPLLKVLSASGSYIYLEGGGSLLDVISSWWIKSLGHGHRELQRALVEQAAAFEHCIFSHTTSDLAVKLGEKLSSLTQKLTRVFYACDGTTTVEIALKMAIQYHVTLGKPQKSKIAYLPNSYHGESIYCYSISDVDLFRRSFQHVTNKEQVKLSLDSFYSYGDHKEILGGKNSKKSLEESLSILEEQKDSLAAIIIEPLVQGAGGMLMYSPDFLNGLSLWARENDVFLIFDEVMTGLGRVGNAFAYQYLDFEPDFVCVMKSLSAGWAPFGAVLTTDRVFDVFYGDYNTHKAFMHSNTYTGYALGMAVSLKVLEIYEREGFYEKNKGRGNVLYHAFCEIQKATGGHLAGVRQLGMIAAADLQSSEGLPFPPEKRVGFQIYKEAVKRGLLLRPLGDTLYFLPPYNITNEEIEKATATTIDCVNAVLG